MKKTIVSTNRLMILAVMMVMTISANAARPLVACYHRDARMQVTLDADKEYVLPLHMPSKKDTGILRNGSSLLFTSRSMAIRRSLKLRFQIHSPRTALTTVLISS